MGNGMIILGLFGIASVIAGNTDSVYKGVTGLVGDSRTLPAITLIVGLMVMGGVSKSKNWGNLTKSLAVLITVSLVFSVYKNPITWLPKFMQIDSKAS